MIEVCKRKDAPKAVQARYDSEWFMIVDPGEGSLLGRVETEQQMKRICLHENNVIFMRQPGTMDGKIIHTGSVVDPLIAGMRLGAQT